MVMLGGGAKLMVWISTVKIECLLCGWCGIACKLQGYCGG
jgi:hypothetical protein